MGVNIFLLISLLLLVSFGAVNTLSLEKLETLSNDDPDFDDESVWNSLKSCLDKNDEESKRILCLANHFRALRKSRHWLENRPEAFWPKTVLDCVDANLTQRMPFMHLRVPRPHYLQFIEASPLLKCQRHLSQPVAAYFAKRQGDCDDPLRLGLMDFKFDTRYPPEVIVERLHLTESQVCKATFLSLSPEQRRASTTTTAPRTSSTSKSDHKTLDPFDFEADHLDGLSTTHVVRRSHELQTNWWFIVAIVIMACFSPCACKSRHDDADDNQEQNNHDDNNNHLPPSNQETSGVSRGACFYDQSLNWASTHAQRPPPYEASKNNMEPPPSYEEAINA